MKTLLISLICTCASITLFAQTDTTNTQTDTTKTITDTTLNNTTQGTDTSAYMNNSNNSTTNTSSNSTMTNNSTGNWNDSMKSNTAVATEKASLPVLETYVPENVVEQAKQKYPNGEIYDITAVRSPEDTVAENSTAMATSLDSTKNNKVMDPDHDNDHDSTMTQNSNANQNNTTVSNYNNGNMESASATPEKYDYIVRVIQNGQMTTETLSSDGTAMVNRKSSVATNSQ